MCPYDGPVKLILTEHKVVANCVSNHMWGMATIWPLAPELQHDATLKLTLDLLDIKCHHFSILSYQTFVWIFVIIVICQYFNILAMERESRKWIWEVRLTWDVSLICCNYRAKFTLTLTLMSKGWLEQLSIVHGEDGCETKSLKKWHSSQVHTELYICSYYLSYLQWEVV